MTKFSQKTKLKSKLWHTQVAHVLRSFLTSCSVCKHCMQIIFRCPDKHFFKVDGDRWSYDDTLQPHVRQFNPWSLKARCSFCSADHRCCIVVRCCFWDTFGPCPLFVFIALPVVFIVTSCSVC